ncbi:MAG: helix-turn-helix transcriptional regulator [Clostridia bacterium]|nr:helix-turn-helix transcriptional regulator [Clostridia bacterium]
MKVYYEHLRDLREDNDLTQKQVAEILGTSQTMYARYERGANELPIRHLTVLCKLFNVSADTILNIELTSSRQTGRISNETRRRFPDKTPRRRNKPS